MRVFSTYEEVKGMFPCKEKPVELQAKRMQEEFQVESLEGNYKMGKAGDYLMRGVRGELYICDKEIFEETYDWVDLPF